MVMKTTYIYGLVDPRDNEIRYIGQSIDPEQRFKIHWRERCKHKIVVSNHKYQSEKALWLYELDMQGLKPSMTIIEQCDPKEADQKELYWIKEYSKNGRWLTNRNLHRNHNRGRLQKFYRNMYWKAFGK